MRFLLDENFPLGLVRALQADGLTADHIITLGWRGAPDGRIRERLQDSEITFFTQDDDFLFGEAVPAIVVLSRVRQSRPLKERIDVWRRAAGELARTSRSERLFELIDDGALLQWHDVPRGR